MADNGFLNGFGHIETRLKRIVGNLAFRILFALLAPAASLAGLVYLYRYGMTRNAIPRCLFYSLTGLYCPGCGSGRALYHILHLDPAGALGFNPLFCLVLPIVLYYGIKTYLDIVAAKTVWPDIPISYTVLEVTLVVLILYTVLRNIHLTPFNLLAPPE